MGINRRSRPLLAYGIDNALQNLAPEPVVSQRDPTTNDVAELGTLWVNKKTNKYFVLTSVVSGTAHWEAESTGGAGSLNLIQTQSVNSAMAAEFTTGITPTYNNYLINITNLSFSNVTNPLGLGMQFSTDGGSTYETTNYASTFDAMFIVSAISSASTSTLFYGSGGLYNLTSGVGFPVVSTGPNFEGIDAISLTNVQASGITDGYTITPTVVNAFQLVSSDGFGTNYAFSGTFSLYGYAQ